MKKFEELNVTNSTIVFMDGDEIRTTQDPYITEQEGWFDDKPFYKAHGVDDENNEYIIYWKIVDEETTDESNACDWENPSFIEALEG